MLTTNKIARYVELGYEHRNWYRKTNNDICELFPFENTNMVIDMLAATSIRSGVSSNVTQFFKALNQYKHNKPFNGFLDAVKINLNMAITGQPLTGRKIRNFSEAMKGNPNAVVCDIWISRALGVDRKSWRIVNGNETYLSAGPTDKIYSAVENYFLKESVNYNMDPREMQAAVWAGIRIDEKADSVGTTYRDFILKRTSQLNLF